MKTCLCFAIGILVLVTHPFSSLADTNASLPMAAATGSVQQVVIRGEVKKPGAYPLVSNMTVESLIAKAGGLTDWAGYIQIWHDGKLRETHRLNERNVEKKKTLQDVMKAELATGDEIRIWRFY